MPTRPLKTGCGSPLAAPRQHSGDAKMLLRCKVKHWRKTETNPYEFYGLDFSDGTVHDVTDERKVNKLMALGFFEEVAPPKTPPPPQQKNDRKVKTNGHNYKG